MKLRRKRADPPGRHPVVELVDRLCRREDRVLIAIERPGLSLAQDGAAGTYPAWPGNRRRTMIRNGASGSGQEDRVLLPGHARYAPSAIPARPVYDWPDGKRLAFYIGMNIEVFGFLAGLGPDPVVGSGPQTHRNYAWRDYGNRVGIWNLFDLLDEFALPASCIVNAWLYDHYPEIFDRIRGRGDAIVGHGRTNAERQSELWEEDERRLIAEATDSIERHEGVRPAGWLGPGSVETAVTLDLLKEAGYRYCLDWPCDDQPIWLNTRSGKLLSVPYPFELNDIGQIVFRRHTAREFADMIVDQFEAMVRQCVDRPLVLSVSLHSFIAGQPFRVTALRRAFDHIRQHELRDRVWFTHSDAIAEYCHGLDPVTLPGG